MRIANVFGFSNQAKLNILLDSIAPFVRTDLQERFWSRISLRRYRVYRLICSVWKSKGASSAYIALSGLGQRQQLIMQKGLIHLKSTGTKLWISKVKNSGYILRLHRRMLGEDRGSRRLSMTAFNIAHEVAIKPSPSLQWPGYRNRTQ